MVVYKGYEMLFENFRKFGGLSLGYTKLNTLERVPPPWQLPCLRTRALHLHLVSLSFYLQLLTSAIRLLHTNQLPLLVEHSLSKVAHLSFMMNQQEA